MLPAPRDHFEKTVAKQRRLPAGDPELFRFGIDEIDQPEMFVETVGVVDRFRRLRAHETEAVALLSDEDEIVGR